MKKQVLVLISSLLFLAISLSSYSQSNSGGKVSAKDAKTIKAMDKALAKGDFVSYTKLKAGIFGYINCLSPSYSGCDSPVELITNAGDVEGQAGVSSIVWKAYDYTLGPGNEVLLPAGVITNNPVLKKWYFNPDMVPTYMNGKYIYFTVLVKKGPLEATTEDWAVFYQKPLQFDFVSPTLSLCQNDSVDIILNVNLDDKYTTYNLYKDGIATGKSVVGNGLPIAFKVGESGNYTVVGEIVYDPMLAPLPFPAPCTTVMNGSITVTVNPLPIINVTNDAPFCSGTQPLHLYCDNAAVTYSWSSFPNTSFTSTLQNPIINPGTTSDNGFYYLHVVDSKGCENFDTTQVNINPLPIIQLNSLTSTPCVNNAAGDEYSTDAGMDNYVWTFPGSTEGVGNDYIIVSGSGTNKIYINWLTPGPKTVAVIYNTPAPAGCTLPSPKTITVTVNPLPTITKTNTDKESCKDFSDTYSTEAGMSGYNWVITSGTGTIQAGTENTANAVITWTGGASGQVTVTYTNASGCSSTSAPYNVTINPLPTATASNNGPACEGGNVTLTGGANGLTTYAWSGPNSYTSSAQSPVLSAVTVANAGTYTITVTDSKGCVNTNSTNVVVNAQPDATFTPDIAGAVCQGTTVKYTTQGAPNNSWDWTIVGGTIAAGGDGFNTVDVTWNNAAAPTKSVTVNYKNSPAGCMDLTPQVTNVVVNPLPTPTVLTGPTTPCIGSTGNIYTTQTGFSGYLWSIPVGSGTITSGQGTSSVTIDWLTQGSHNITVQYQGATVPACTATSPPYVVDVKPLPAAPTVTASPNPVCSGKSVTLTGAPATYAGYSWAGPDVITNSSAAVASVNSAITTGSYTLTVTDNFGCKNSASTNLTVDALPTPTIITPATLSPVCQGSTVTYTTQGAPNKNWDWTIVGGSVQGVEDGASSVTVKWSNAVGPNSISVSYENASNCRATSPVYTIVVDPTPVPTLITPATVCANSTGTYTTDAGMQAGSYLWSVVGGTISGPNNLSTVNVDWGVVNPAASLSVHYVNPAGCASSTKLNNLAITGLPTPTISLPVSNEACVGTPITYRTQVGMSGYVWTVSAGGTPITSLTDNDSLTVVWNNPGATESVTVNYSNGCMGASPGSKTVNVNPKPDPKIYSFNTTLCEGVPNVQYWTEAGMDAYDWKIVGGIITSPTNTDKIEVTWLPGEIHHSLSINYSLPHTGCRAPSPVVYTYIVNPLPMPSITGTANVCQGAVNVLYSTEFGGGSITGYQWTISSGGQILSGSGTDQILVKWNNPGAQNVSVNYTSSAGCTASAPTVFPVTVNATPAPSISGNALACVGSTKNYTTETGFVNYVWSVSSNGTIISGQGTNSVQIQWNSVSSSESVSVIYNDAIGCTPATATSFAVNVVPLPTISLGGSVNACTNSTVQYTAPAGMTNYQWVVSGGTKVSFGSATDNVVDVLWPPTAGVGSVSVNYTDANGCTASSPLVANVTVGTTSTPSILGLTSVCQGTTGVTYVTESGMNGYIWNVSAGGNITSGAGTNSITVDWVGSGAQTVSVNYTNPSGCPVLGPIVHDVTVNALPIIETISGSSNGCLNSTSTYSIPNGYININWSVSANGSIVGVNNGSTVTVLWSGLGAGSVSVSYTSAAGCSPTAIPSKAVVVNDLPSPSITGVNTVCNGSSGIGYATEVGMSSYSWNISGGLILNGANTNAVTVLWNVPGTGSISVNYNNASGCSAASPTLSNVNVTPISIPVIAGANQACINTAGVIYNTGSVAGISNYVWTISGGTIDSGQGTSSVSVTWTSTINTSISVSYDENGCTGTSAPYSVTVNNLPLTQTALTSPVNGEYCAGGAGVDILLASSEPTVMYQLFDAADVLIGTVPAGTSPVVWTGIPAGTYYVTGTGALPSSCSRVVASGILVKSNPLPTAYSIDPSNTVVGCNGGAGYVVGLVDSDLGITYQLLLNGGAVGTAVPGTGSAITFGAQSSFGTYTVLATNDLTGCNLVMSNSFVMNPDVATTTYNLIANPPSGAYCDLPSGGVDISLSGSDVGVNYILKMGGNDIETVAGTGALINFARVKSAGTYSISVATLTGCGAPMTGNVKVQPVTPPLQYNVEASNAGFFCSGDAGASLQISGQQAGMVYQLFQFGNPLPIDTQTGLVDNPTLPLLFSGLYSDGTYSVLANHPLVAGCFVAMNNNVTVTANPLPVSYVVTSDGDFCVGGSTNINLSNSDISAQYRVVNVDDNSTSTWTLGTGSPLSFSVSNSGNYTVEASNIANGITCTNWMQDTVTVTAQNLPSDVSVVTSGGTGCNDGVVITILSSQAGVSYSVVDQVLGTTQGAPVIGNGLDISFPPIVDSGKIYDIHANSNGCDRIVGSPITVNISGVITKQLVTGGGTICSGNSATIGLGDTEVGVQYNLYLADAPGGTSSLPAIASLVGDGLNKTFGATISTNGEYYVEGSSGGCINEMANRVVVSLNPTINAQIIVSPNDTVCANSAVLFTGRGGDRYTFYLNNSSLGMAADSTLNLASVLDGAQIKVFVENSVTGCSGMSLPITMSVDDQLSSFTLQSVSGGLICPSTTDSLYLSGSEWGVDYVLYNQTDSPIDTISGNNGVVYFANISTGSYYVIASRAGGSPCGVQAMNDTVSVTISPVPTIYDLSPNGVENGCLGGNIDLNGSDLGVSYHLVRNGVNVVASIPGTGIAISFVKPLVAGLYTIQAIYGNGCSVNMNGSLDIVNPPTENIYTLSANPLDGRYCNNGSNPGVALTLSNSDATKTYSLYRDGTSIKDTISVGGAINFGSHTTAGFYSVLIASNNGCFDQMDSVIHIVPVAPPTAFALQVDNGGSYCVSGGTGVGIQLVGQQDDVVYELYLGGVKVGEAVGIDNNSATDLPFMNTSNGTYLFTTAGTYSVVAHYVMPVGCDVNMINSVNVVPTADPTNFIVSTAGDFCEGGSTIINVNGSETAVDYRWINITTTDAGAWTVGTGGLLQFSGINLSGDYIVEARSNLGASCTVTLLDTVTVVEVKMPHARNYTVENGGTCSDASLIIVENAEPGVVYTLIDAITNVPTSISFVGNTNLLDTMQIIDSNGKYFIQAARMNCSINFPGAPFIDINNADPATVKKHVVTPVDASICNGELGVKFGLLTNTAGIRYTLYWSLDNSKDAVPQDTIDSFIGNGLANQQFSKLGKKRGTYYVLGESATCKNYMTNDPELVVNPLPTAFKVTGSGMYCDPDPNPLIGGAQIGVEHQEDRVLYTLQQYDTNDDYVNDVAEFRGSLSGLPFVFGSYKESGINNIYRVVAIDTITGCTSNMNGRVEVQFMTTPPDLPVVNLGISNGRYCQGTNGAPIVIDTPQVGLTYQVFLEKLPVDTIVMQKVALTTDPLTLGYVEVGKYHVNASWGGDACIQSSSSFDITQRIPMAFNVDYDCGVTDSSAISSVLNAGRISLDSSEIGITYLVYDSGLNLVGFNNGIDAPLTFTGLYGAGKYSVQGTCSASATPLPMANDITITFPVDTFDLTIRSRSSLTGVRGDTILIDGFETNATYYSRIETWVDTFSIGALAVTPPLEFPTDSAGMYHILAINDHNCGAIINKTATILETMLVANNDTLRFGKSDLIGSIAVGLNDYLDRGRVDIEGDPAINPKANIVYRLVHGGLNPDISLDSVSGLFTYVKSPTFFGKDSIRYAVINKDVPNRADTALVWIFVGNKDIGSRTFLIPNAFSPNGDGINDYFVITTIYAYSTEESELEIYNRWGSLVYRSKDKSYDNKWDGHANANLISIGDVLPNGTYFYIYKVTFNVNGVLNKEEYNGFIELRR